MAKAIMIQGTASNAGKSFLTAGLCRLFRQEGFRVAPFKPQNMALNSFITPDGLEIGRAQAMQCEAAGAVPSALMNPILLKPSSDTGSQVIVNGEVLGNMDARTYYRYKAQLIPEVERAFAQLAAQYDVIVIEGAGSPAEINLKENDIANMGMARIARAPVLLAGDIDRGGVFAALAGTMLLLEPWERTLVKGCIINKFRGDPSILEPGLRMLEERIRIPSIGVVPYLHVDIDDEDSLSGRLSCARNAGPVDIAVIRFPHISNFTDLHALEILEGISVRYIGKAADFGQPDMVVLPGTKNTMGDLLWMRQNGLEALIKKHAAANGIVFGICGGYQMLGVRLDDPGNVEHGGSLAGIGLLPAYTIFQPQKARCQAKGRFLPMEGGLSPLSGAAAEGYEVHMGETKQSGAALPLLILDGGRADGLHSGNVYGCYLHGIFDTREAAQGIRKALYERKGLTCQASAGESDFRSYKEQQYDLLAQALREHLDLDAVFRILENGLG